MDQLKSLVIQTLDTNGVLDKVRGQLRDQVFKAIESSENQTQMETEMTEAEKVMMTEEGQIAIELIRDFLEFYKLDYSVNVLLPECKLPDEPRQREFISQQLGYKGDIRQPLLSQIVQQRKDVIINAQAKATKAMSRGDKSPEDVVKLAPLKQAANQKLPPMNLQSSFEKPGTSGAGRSPPGKKQSPAKVSSPEKEELYTEDFDEIDEEIEVEDFDEPQDSVGNVITDSQGTSSMGVDASVNSMTLEGYDHVEPVSRIPR